MSTPFTPRLAYLISRYPALSHSFILREVACLENQGFTIPVASINSPDRDDGELTDQERQAKAATFYVKQQGIGGALRALGATFWSHPLGLLRGLWCALRLAGWEPRRLLYHGFYLLEALLVGRWMMAQGLSHVHVHFATQVATVGYLASRVFPLSFSLTVHGPDEFYEVSTYNLSAKFSAARFVVCIGHYARSQVMKLSPPWCWDKFDICPLGVDPALFASTPFRETPQPFQILCVGRLVPAKGQHVLLNAVADLHNQGRQIHLRLVGTGPDWESLQRQVEALGIAPVVVFEGGVNQSRIRDLYRQADLFVLASFAEGIPVVLMEAMAMEIACISTFITGIPELIRPGKDGLLVAPGDDQGLAEVIATLMDDPRRRKTLARAGRRRVMSHYHLGDNVARLAACLTRRLEGG